jgi:hypothetical protein
VLFAYIFIAAILFIVSHAHALPKPFLLTGKGFIDFGFFKKTRMAYFLSLVQAKALAGFAKKIPPVPPYVLIISFSSFWE